MIQETEDYDGMNLEGLQEEFEGNKDAARALMRVKQKLDGYEGGEMRSIHGQVKLFFFGFFDILIRSLNSKSFNLFFVHELTKCICTNTLVAL